jgi:hypothetical protein
MRDAAEELVADWRFNMIDFGIIATIGWWEITKAFLLFTLAATAFVFYMLVMILLVKFLVKVPKEQQLTRFEVGKLAEEVRQIRKEFNESRKGS